MPFKIGENLISRNMILAPMDGYTSQPFRLFARRLGSAASYSEFINAMDISQKNPHLEEKLKFDEEERPFCYQIFDNDPARILYAAQVLRERNPDFLDLNLGCSAKHVSARGAGAGLLKDPVKISLILDMLVKNLDIPITAKIRLGWDDSTQNYLEVSKRVEQAGCSAIAVHARTKQQGYKGQANWEAIAQIKNNISIPVIGNGDVQTVQDSIRMMEQTSCDAVMVGRAALSNPWIFSGLNSIEIPPQRLLDDTRTLTDLMQSFYGLERGLVLSRKFIARFILPFHVPPEVRKKLLSSSSSEQVDCMLREIIPGKRLSADRCSD